MKVCVHVLIEQPRTYCVHGCSIPDFIPLVLIEQTCTQYVHGNGRRQKMGSQVNECNRDFSAGPLTGVAFSCELVGQSIHDTR